MKVRSNSGPVRIRIQMNMRAWIRIRTKSVQIHNTVKELSIDIFFHGIVASVGDPIDFFRIRIQTNSDSNSAPFGSGSESE